MLFGNRVPRSPVSRSRRRGAYRPGGERLETRALLAAIDLINVAGSTTPNQPGPYGVEMVGQNSRDGAGYSVADVGDVNGDGFDDFVIGAPTINTSGAFPTLSNGRGTVYLVFGSAQVNQQTIDFLTLNPQQRIGDLSVLGNTNQTNPVNGLPGLAFNGLTIIASQNATGLLGATVQAVGDVNGDGLADFMIGAPGANSSTGIPGTGRAYLIYGSANLSSRTNKLVDLDNPSANTDLNIMTFVNTLAGSQTGRSVGNVGDLLTDGNRDIAIGAPNASYNGMSGNGAVYVISGGFLAPARTQTVNLQNVGQGGANNVPGVLFTGANSGDQAGFSVAGAGNFNGATTSVGQSIDDILIGAPQTTTGSGSAYLVYGAINLASQATTTNGVTSITLNRVGSTSVSNPVPGVVFTGANNGDQTGFSVSTAGDFNNDGISDIMIGSPFADPGGLTDSGRVTLVFGQSASSATGQLSGTISLNSIPANNQGIEFDGAAAGAFAGFSVSAVGRINNDGINEILIGSPGFNNQQGIVYLIPGNTDLIGTVPLANAGNAPAQATLITLSQPTSANFLGTSVSGRPLFLNQSQTLDSDTVADFVVGAAEYALPVPNQTKPPTGAAFALEGALVPLATPVSTVITSPIGVDKVQPPFVVNPTTPADMKVFILSRNSNTAGFNPYATIDPNTITVNGVPLPDPSTWKQEPDIDGDGIPDASFTIPKSVLNLTTSTRTLTVNARTLSSSPFPNRRYQGTANITVSSGGGGGGGGLPGNFVAFNGAFPNTNQAVPRFGEQMLPQPLALNQLHWKPLSYRQAYRQFVPQGAFGFRYRNFYHKDAQMQRPKGRTIALERNVFTRGRFKPGAFFGRTNHKGPVIGG